MTEPLSIWTIYDHPADYPLDFVAREYHLDQATNNVLQCPTLELLREIMLVEFGLTCIPRSPDDDPTIIESWV